MNSISCRICFGRAKDESKQDRANETDELATLMVFPSF
jgi:hypothetical protein